MAKTGTPQTVPPSAFLLGQDVESTDLRAIARALNWAVSNRNETHISLTIGHGDTSDLINGWDDYSDTPAGFGAGNSDAAGTLRVRLEDNNQLDFIETDIWVDKDASRSFECGAEWDVPSGSEVTITFTFFPDSGGSPTGSIVYADTDTNEQTVSIDVSGSTNGGEWVRVRIQAQRTSGSGICEGKTVRVQEESITTSNIQDPLND